MKFFRKASATRTDIKKAAAAEHAYIENTTSPIWRLTDFSSYLSMGSSKVWATFRACHLVGSVFMATDFGLRKKNNAWKSDPKSPLAKLLVNPNPFNTWDEMLYLLAFHLKLTGCGFWMKDQINGLGQPTALYPLLPQNIKINPDRKKGIASFTYTVNGRTIELQPEEIIYFRRPSPVDLVLGMGDVEPSVGLFNDFVNRAAFQEKFIANGAQPSGILTLNDTNPDPEEWGKLKSWWNREYGGKANAGKTAFLSGDWKYQKLGLTQQEMQSLAKEQTTVEQIFMTHGVPLSVAGVNSAANYATAKTDEINFRKYEIVPLLSMIVSKLNAEGSFVKLFDKDAELYYELSGLIDVQQIVAEYLPLVNTGAMTLNELRKKAGLDEVKNDLLNAFYLNGSPLESAGGGGEAPPAPPAPAPPTPPVEPPITVKMMQKIIEEFKNQ